MRLPGTTEAYDLFDPDDIETPEDSDDESEEVDTSEQQMDSCKETDEESDHSSSSSDTTPNIYYPIREGLEQRDIPTRGFRSWPRNATILPWLKAVAKAVKCMPALKSMSMTGGAMSASDPHEDIGGLEFTFAGKGDDPILYNHYDELEGMKEENRWRNRLLRGTSGWRPDDELTMLWNEARTSEKGDELLVFFETSPYNPPGSGHGDGDHH